MKNKYFTILFKNFDSEFNLLDNISDTLAHDLSGNSIILINKEVFLFIHDSNPSNIKLFDNIDEFYKKTYFYDEDESQIRYDKFINEYREKTAYSTKKIPEKELYISTVIKHIGSKKILNKYKNGSYYNVTQAYLDGNLSEKEFKKLYAL